jgi:2',3'-cyclic-nucleotide 2'-phosphodiesterase (5'-nucleotidase family)
MLGRVCAFTAFVLLAWVSAVPLRIAYTGYVHGGIASTGGDSFCMVGGIPDPADLTSSCLGGCDRRQTFFEQKKAADPDTIIADVGNYYWGSVFFTMYGAAPGYECFRRARYDVSGLGGSDMYSGYATYSQWTKNVTQAAIDVGTTPTAFIATNVAFGPNPDGANPLADIVKTSWLKTLSNGLKVGFVTPLSPYYNETIELPAGDLAINPRATTANHLRQEISKLRQQGAVFIVMLMEYTNNFGEDLALPKELEHVRVVLTCRNKDAFSKHVVNDYGEDVLVLSVGEAFGTTVGWVEADIDATTGQFTDFAAALAASVPIVINSDGNKVVPNADTRAAIMASYDLSTNEAFIRQVGTTRGSIYGQSGLWETATQAMVAGCRTASCPMGRLIVQSMLDHCPAGSNGSCIALVNGGSIRRSINATIDPSTGVGILRTSDVYQVLPFFNSIVSLNVKGRVVFAALANAISQRPASNGRFLQSNLRFYFNSYDRPDIDPTDYPSRVLDASLKNPTTGVWTAIDPDATYTVITSSFLTAGRDGYTDLALHSAGQTEIGVTFSDAFIDHVTRVSNQTGVPLDLVSQQHEQSCTTATLPLDDDSDCMTVTANLTNREYHRCASDEGFCAAHANSFLFESIWVSGGAGCDECSGVGICKARRCECSGSHAATVPDGAGGTATVVYTFADGAPTSGPWEGVELIRGDACSELRSVWTLATGDQTAMYVAAALAYLASIAWFIVLFLNREKSVMRASSPLFGMLMCLGGVIGATTILMDAHADGTDMCNASVWLLVVGYSLIFACLFVKTHRIHTIFNAKRLKGRAVYTDAHVLLYVGAITLINIIILIVFRVVSPLELRPFVLTAKFAVGERCSSDNIIFTAILFVYNGLLLAWGIYLAVRTRNVDSNFNESKWIGIAVYNCAFSALVMLLVMYVISNTEPSIALIIKSWLLAYIIIVTLSIMFVPRVRLIVRGISQAEATGATGARSTSAPSDLEKALAHQKRTMHVLVQRMREHDAERDAFIDTLKKTLEQNSIPVPAFTFKPAPDPEAVAASVVATPTAMPSASSAIATPHMPPLSPTATGGAGGNVSGSHSRRGSAGGGFGLTASGAIRRPLFANQQRFLSPPVSPTAGTAISDSTASAHDPIYLAPPGTGSSTPRAVSLESGAVPSSSAAATTSPGDVELSPLGGPHH